MADDALIPEGEKPPAPVTQADLDRVTQAHAKSLADFTKEVTGAISQLRTNQAPPKTPDPPRQATGDEFLDEFVKDGKGTISRVVQEAIQNTMGPWVQSQASSTADNLTNTHRAKVDSQYGEGAWDEIIAPEMEKILSQLDPQTQLIARGNKATFETIFKQARGEDGIMEKLHERKAKLPPPPDMLGEGRTPTPKPGLTPEDKEWMGRYEDSTGHKLDSKALTQLIEHKRKHGGWAIQDMPGMKNRLNLDR
jgi:hypothetical protein